MPGTLDPPRRLRFGPGKSPGVPGDIWLDDNDHQSGSFLHPDAGGVLGDCWNSRVFATNTSDQTPISCDMGTTYAERLVFKPRRVLKRGRPPASRKLPYVQQNLLWVQVWRHRWSGLSYMEAIGRAAEEFRTSVAQARASTMRSHAC